MHRPARQLLAPSLTLCLCASLAEPAVAQSSLDAVEGDPADRPLRFGLRLGFGTAGASKADDGFGEPTLLFGSAFTGSSLQASVVGSYRLTLPSSSLHASIRWELGMATYSTEGFAETPAYRREIRFSTTHLEIPLLIELAWRAGPVLVGAHAGAGIRFGVAASAEEIRGPGSPPDPPLSIRTGGSPSVLIGASIAADMGRWVLPLDVRFRWNPTYPSTTRDRFDAWRSESSTGAYLVDTGWALVFSTGFDLRFGTPRAASAPVSAYVPPPDYSPPPPPPPPPPTLPDHDGDGVPDMYDACPIEPIQPGEIGPFPGCPESGGIVTVSCDYIDIAAPIDFDSGSARVSDSSWPILYILADTLAVTRNIRLVRVEGHTDDRGSATANRRLSQERAEAVVDFLIDAGVEPHRLEAVGYGPDYPVADNRTEQGRQMNRRVEFLILENDTCQ
jgi:hypothetical protein